MREDFVARCRKKIKTAGYSGEIADNNSVMTWRPRADQTAPQISAANAIVTAYDNAADAVQQLAEERAAALALLDATEGLPKALRALVLMILDEFNAHALKINAILDAVDASTTLANLKSAVALIADYPQRTAAQLKTVEQNKINTGAAD